MELGTYLVHYGFARDYDEAERMVERGSIRIDGKTVSNVHFIPEGGSTLSSLENAYTVLIPWRK
jgi:ribosomal protein S4